MGRHGQETLAFVGRWASRTTHVIVDPFKGTFDKQLVTRQRRKKHVCNKHSITEKHGLGDHPSSQAKAVAEDRWSLIIGCTQNVYTDVCMKHTSRQASIVLVQIKKERKKEIIMYMYMYRTCTLLVVRDLSNSSCKVCTEDDS